MKLEGLGTRLHVQVYASRQPEVLAVTSPHQGPLLQAGVVGRLPCVQLQKHHAKAVDISSWCQLLVS